MLMNSEEIGLIEVEKSGDQPLYYPGSPNDARERKKKARIPVDVNWYPLNKLPLELPIAIRKKYTEAAGAED